LDRIKTIALFFDILNEKEMQVLKHWIENSVEDRLSKEAIKILSSSKEEVEGMVASNAYIITEMEEKAEKKGIEKGLNIGIEKGVNIGIEIGKKTEEKNKIDLIKEMLLDHEPIEKIKRYTKLSEEEIEKIRTPHSTLKS